MTAPAGSRPTTKAERAVVALLTGRREFCSAQQIHAQLRGAGSPIGLSSVYRAVQRLREAGQLDEVRRSSGETLYRRCPTGHHHHLTCERCGATVELQTVATERWVDQVAEEHGYRATGHVLEVSGLCPGCQRS